jgi:hypothetical protein
MKFRDDLFLFLNSSLLIDLACLIEEITQTHTESHSTNIISPNSIGT